MILQKYMAGINSLIIVVLSAVVAIPSGMLDFTSGAQIVAVALSGVMLYIFPLVNAKWKGVLKTGTALLGAAVATAFPLFQVVIEGGAWEPIYIVLIALAIAHALAVQLGVDVRVDTGSILAEDTTPIESEVNQEDESPVTVQLSEFDRQILTQAIAEPAPGSFAVGAGYQDPNVPYVPYGESPMYNGASTAQLETVNPANADDD